MGSKFSPAYTSAGVCAIAALAAVEMNTHIKFFSALQALACFFLRISASKALNEQIFWSIAAAFAFPELFNEFIISAGMKFSRVF